MKTNKEIITEIIEDLEYNDEITWLTKLSKVNKEKLISCWSIYRENPEYKFYGYTTSDGLYGAYKKLFKISKANIGESWKSYILRLYGYKYCYKCINLLGLDKFSKDQSKVSQLKAECKECYSKNIKSKLGKRKEAAKSAKYRASKLQRTPVWSNLEEIKEIYKNCPEGYHVDHEIPLQGELVSGLHIPENLQYLTATENLSKGNRFKIG